MASVSSVAPYLREDNEVGNENHRHHEAWNDEHGESSQLYHPVGIAVQEHNPLSCREDHQDVGRDVGAL